MNSKIRLVALLTLVAVVLTVTVSCGKDKDHEYGDLVPSSSESTTEENVEPGLPTEVETEDDTFVIDATETRNPEDYTAGVIPGTAIGSSNNTDDEKDDKKEDGKKEDSSSSSTSSSSSSKVEDVTSGIESSVGKWTGWIIPQ